MYTCHIHKCTNTQKNDITTYWGLVTLKYYFRVSSQGLSKVSEQAFYRNNSKDKESGQYRGFGAYGSWCIKSRVCRAAAGIDLLQES